MTLAKRNSVTSNPFLRSWLGFDPFAELSQYQQAQASTFTPRFELSESEDAYLVRADLPGIKQDDLEVTLHQGVLTVKGKRIAEEERQKETYHVYERSFGTFSRSFSLPDGADPDKIDANLKDGVLTLSIPKRAEAQPVRVKIK